VIEQDRELLEAAAIRFHMRYVTKDPLGYYVTNWGNALPIDLLAATAQGAHEKAIRILGDPPKGKQWALTIDRITEELPGTRAAAAMSEGQEG